MGTFRRSTNTQYMKIFQTQISINTKTSDYILLKADTMLHFIYTLWVKKHATVVWVCPLSKFGKTHLIFVDPEIKINGT